MIRALLAYSALGVLVASLSAQRPAQAPVAREVRVSIDYGIGGPGPLVQLVVGIDSSVWGALFACDGVLPSGLPDSIVTMFAEMRERKFARVGCLRRVRMGRDMACEARFPAGAPDWKAVLRIVDSTLAADSLTERAEILARQPQITPDGMVRIRGRNDGSGVDAEIRERGLHRTWRVGRDSVVVQLIDSLIAKAAEGRR